MGQECWQTGAERGGPSGTAYLAGQRGSRWAARGEREGCAPPALPAAPGLLPRPAGRLSLAFTTPSLPLPGKRQNWLCSRKWKRHAGLSAAVGEPLWGSAPAEFAAEPWQCRLRLAASPGRSRAGSAGAPWVNNGGNPGDC